MLIRMFGATPDSNDIMETCGIKDHKRTINIFVNKAEYKSGICKTGRAIMINESLTQGDKTYHLCKIRNGNIIKISVYYFDVVFENVNDLRSAIFTLTESFGAERQISYDALYRPTTVFDFSEYSSILSGVDEYTRSFMDGTDETFIPPPKYYNEIHMNMVEHDFASIIGYDTIMYFTGYELFDDVTTTNLYDIAFWDTMNPIMREKLTKDQMKNVDTVGDISSELFMTFSNAAIDKGVYIYDSELGVNIKSVIFPYAQYQHKNVMLDELNKSKKAFILACKDIENKHGSVRVLMNQGLIGDTYSIMCKDYDERNQPFRVCDSDKKTISIDKSYPTEANVNEFLYSMAPQDE